VLTRFITRHLVTDGKTLFDSVRKLYTIHRYTK